MLIWINGPFGGGKTVTAFELLSQVLAQHEGPVIAPMTLVNSGYFAEAARA